MIPRLDSGHYPSRSFMDDWSKPRQKTTVNTGIMYKPANNYQIPKIDRETVSKALTVVAIALCLGLTFTLGYIIGSNKSYL